MSIYNRIWYSMGATPNKNQNISIQLRKFPRSSKIKVLSDDDLTENEINQKSTSDRTKRRVAHVPKYTIPVTKKTISPTKKQEDPEQKYQKQIRPVTNNLKTVQNMHGTCHRKVEKLRNYINTIPWEYRNMCHSRHISEKQRLDNLESTNMKMKKPKTNSCELRHRLYCIDCGTFVK